MNASQRPPSINLNVTPEVQLSVPAFEIAVRDCVLADAFSQNDSTFLICRTMDIAVRMNPGLLLDKLAQRNDWLCLRAQLGALSIRTVGLFGMISADGPPKKCLVSVYLWADSAERADATMDIILKEVSQHQIRDVAFSLRWRFLACRGEIKKATTEEQASDDLLNEAYPALGDVEDFINQYLTAPESVLVLQGPPGTGKTRLIRSILGHISRRKNETADVLYTGDKGILENDEVFVEFITGNHDAFVVEDADHLLTPRSDGNQTLHRFLNIADGIAQAHGRKIIFSTNLPNIRDIDNALLRPGRCFAHVFLQELPASKARELLKRLCHNNLDQLSPAFSCLEDTSKKTYSVAEVYAAHRKVTQPTSHTQMLRCSEPEQSRASFGFAV